MNFEQALLLITGAGIAIVALVVWRAAVIVKTKTTDALGRVKAELDAIRAIPGQLGAIAVTPTPVAAPLAPPAAQ